MLGVWSYCRSSFVLCEVYHTTCRVILVRGVSFRCVDSICVHFLLLLLLLQNEEDRLLTLGCFVLSEVREKDLSSILGSELDWFGRERRRRQEECVAKISRSLKTVCACMPRLRRWWLCYVDHVT